jgi:hypothetical protein
METNILKLLKCTWSHRISNNDFKIVHYYVQYERVNHIVHAIYDEYKKFKMLNRHEDDIDKEIYKALFNYLYINPEISNLRIYFDELPLYFGVEEKNRALFTNSAFGYDYTDVEIRTKTHQIVNLDTKVMFNGVSDNFIQGVITLSLPRMLNLDITGEIPSLIRADFLEKDRVSEILYREDDVNFS